MLWFRIDNRLIHGQVIESWLPRLEVEALVVVNDALARDEMQQAILGLAVPKRVRVYFLDLMRATEMLPGLERQAGAALVLLENCMDALRLSKLGVRMETLNVGNMHYAQGKRQLCAHIAASEEDLDCFRSLSRSGVQLDFRCVPEDVPDLEEW